VQNKSKAAVSAAVSVCGVHSIGEHLSKVFCLSLTIFALLDGNGNASNNETVLDGGGPRFVPQKGTDQLWHVALVAEQFLKVSAYKMAARPGT
jgi:hypothetical protein